MDSQNKKIRFPDNYDKQTLGLKKKLARKYQIETDFSALDISKNAHVIYDWLTGLGVENPNRSSVDFFDYAAKTLGVPYQLLTESYFTQTPLSEENLFEQSTKFNPKLLEEKKKLNINAKVDVPKFSEKVEEYFKQKQIPELLNQLIIPGTNLTKNNLKRYNLNWLLSDIVKKVWQDTTQSTTPEVNETLKLYFRKYFYKGKQEYSEEFLDMTKSKFTQLIDKENSQDYKEDIELLKILQEERTDIDSVNIYLEDKYSSLNDLKNYKNFLIQLTKAHYLSPNNIFLLMGQKPHFTVVKSPLEWKYCEQEINQNAQPIFLFGDDNKSLMPFFDFNDTQGEMILHSPTLDTRDLILQLKKTYNIQVNFSEYLGNVNHKILNDHTLLVSAALNESYTFQEITVGATGLLYGNLSQFEKTSVDFCILNSFGIDYKEFDEYYISSSEKVKNLEESLVKIQACLDQFNTQITTEFIVEMEEVEFENFDEEVRISKEMESHALDNMQTVKEEKAEKKNKKEAKSITDIGDLIDLELAKKNESANESEDKN